MLMLDLSVFAWLSTGLALWLLPGPAVLWLGAPPLLLMAIAGGALVVRRGAPVGDTTGFILENTPLIDDRDDLTGLANRSGFERRLHELFNRAGDYAPPFALVLLAAECRPVTARGAARTPDDAAVAALGRLLAAMVRGSDVAAHLGANQFGLLIRGADRPAARSLVVRIEQALARWPLSLDTEEQTATGLMVRSGIAVYSPSMLSDEEMLHAAEHQLFRPQIAIDLDPGTATAT